MRAATVVRSDVLDAAAIDGERDVEALGDLAAVERVVSVAAGIEGRSSGPASTETRAMRRGQLSANDDVYGNTQETAIASHGSAHGRSLRGRQTTCREDGDLDTS